MQNSAMASKPLRVIVTGSERGIGRAVARELCSRGHFYYGFSRFNDIDVSDYQCVAAAMQELETDPPDALINNAGIVVPGSIFELTPYNWDKQIAVNLNGLYYCTREYARIAKARGGKIINIASTAGAGARPGRAAYAASKAAVISFSLSMSEELKPYGIKVYCVSPGACATDLRRQIAPDDDFAKLLQPEEVARVVVDLIEHGEYLDGQVLTIKGGRE